MKDKRTLKQEYLSKTTAMGVFLIRNTTNNKVFLVAGINLTGAMNKNRFALKIGKHANRQLQNDWNELGADKFSFEIVDQLEPPADHLFDVRRELDFMETMWLEKLEPYDERGYNERKISSQERLRRIAARQSEVND